MKRLFAVSITLSMLMLPSFTMSSTANAQTVQGESVAQAGGFSGVASGTIIQQPAGEEVDVDIEEDEIEVEFEDDDAVFMEQESVVVTPVAAAAAGVAVVPYGNDGLPLGTTTMGVTTSTVQTAPSVYGTTVVPSTGATTVLTEEGTTVVTEEPVEAVVVDEEVIVTPVAAPVTTGGVVVGGPVVVPYGEDGLPLGTDVSGVQVSQTVVPGETVVSTTVTDTCVGADCPMGMSTTMEVVPGETTVSTGTMMMDQCVGANCPMMSTTTMGVTTDQEVLVATPGGCYLTACPVQGVEGKPAMGVSAEAIEQSTPFSIDRLSPMPDGGVMVTYSTGFMPDEVLVINPQNEPELMTVDASGALVPHPSRRVAFHEGEIMIVDNSINLADLQDNPFPVSTFTEVKTVQGFEREVSLTTSADATHPPLSAADFERSLPVSMTVSSVVQDGNQERVVVYDELGNPVMIEVDMPVDGQVFEAPGEILVAFSSALPVGWRAVVVGNSMLVLDNMGVIRDIIPVEL